ncbi:TolC family protein, partial [Pseudomonas sp. MAFF212428]|nr:TolC family protein [Pseudomonas brassicae]
MRTPNLVVGCLLWLCVPLQAAAQPPAADLWQLYQESRESDPRLLAAQARSRSSSWSEREALGQMLPQIGVSSAFNRTTSETALQQANYNGERYAIGLSQVLYNPELWHSYKRFAALSAVQDAQSRDTREAAGLELVERYFAVLAAEDALALAQAERRATRLNLERVQALFDKQMVKVTDVLEARARTDALASAEIAAANQVQVSREGLSQLIGRPVTEHLRRLGEQVPFNLPPEAREYWVQRALADNPALQAHQRAVLAAQAGEREARA